MIVLDTLPIVESLSDIHFISPTLGVVVALVLAFFLLFVSGFASGSEIAFFSLMPAEMTEISAGKTEIDRKIKSLLDDSERTLATILITNNFVNVTIIMLCNYIFASIVDFGPKAY